jgi:hypothetical protein
MITLLLMIIATEAEPSANAPDVLIEKKIIYQKETSLDFGDAEVRGENQLPPAFFVTKMNTPKAASLLEERLKFKMRNYNELGF